MLRPHEDGGAVVRGDKDFVAHLGQFRDLVQLQRQTGSVLTIHTEIGIFVDAGVSANFDFIIAFILVP